jgi:hypothetical protein
VDGACVDVDGNGGNGGSERVYEFWGQYYVPAFFPYYSHIDGAYIDGDLFAKNIPVRDGTIHIVAAPQTVDLVDKRISFGFPIYQNGAVSRIGHTFHWYPNTGSTLSYDVEYNGHPYGMGLNLFSVEVLIFPIATRNIWFNVRFTFTMEVG